jgi:hypothetical protein
VNGEVRMTPDGRWLPTMGRPLLVTPEWIYLIAMHPYEARNAVIAVPRQDEAIDVVAQVEESLLRVRARDGVLWWIGSTRSGGGLTIAQRDPSTGESRRLATHQGWVSEAAAGNGELYFSDSDGSIYRVSNAGRLTRFASSSYAAGLTVHRNHVFWSDGSQIWAKKKKGDQPFVVTQPSNYGGMEQGAEMVFDDDYLYVTAYGNTGNSIFRISERGEVVTVWEPTAGGAYPLRDLALVGDELFFTGQQGSSYTYGVYRIDRNGEGGLLHALGGNDRYVHEMVAGGGFLYVTMTANDTMELIRVDASSGEAHTVLRWYGYGGEQGLLTADDRGAYLGIEAYDAVIRIAHDAPPLPEPIAFPAM